MYNDDDELKRQQQNHDAGFWLMLLVMVVLVFSCEGCATPLTEYEKADRLAHDRDVWALCVLVYDKSDKPMRTEDVTATRLKMRKGSGQEVRRLRDNIRVNSCRTIYKQIVKQSGR